MQILITDADTGLTYPCKEGESVYAALYRSGKSPIRGGCGGGGCGYCKVRILAGEYSVFKPMSKAHISDEELRQNIVLACCIQAIGSMTLTRKY